MDVSYLIIGNTMYYHAEEIVGHLDFYISVC